MKKVEFLTTMAAFDKKRAVEDMNDYLASKITNAENLIRDLKNYKEKINVVVADKTKNQEEVVNYFEYAANDIENFSRNANFNQAIRISSVYGAANRAMNIINGNLIADGDMS